MARTKLSGLVLALLFFNASCAYSASLTANQVPVSTGGSGTANSSITSIGANNGFNNTSPGYPIDVTGTTRTTNLVVTSLTTGCVTNTNGIISSTGVACGSGGGGGTPAGNTGQYQYNNGGNFAAGNMLYTNGTNIGINNTSPVYQLDVNGIAHATSFTGAGTGLTGTAAGLSVGGNAATVTNGVYTSNIGSTVQAYNSNLTAINQALTSSSSPTFTTVTANLTGNVSGNLTGNVTGNVTGSSGSTTGNAATVTTNANLTGPITSSGNATSVASQTGTGSTFVMNTSPTLITPALGTPTALVGTNITGTASGLTAGNVTTNANLTGPITSVGNTTSINSQTGTGNTFVMNTSPTLVTPTLGVATATSIDKMAITAPASSSTLAVANGKTLTANNTITLAAGADSITETMPATSFSTARIDAGQTFTGHNTFEGVTSTGATGTGNMVFSISPNLTANVGIGSATPGAALDVVGTIRATGINDSGLTASAPVFTTSGKVLSSGFISGTGTTLASSFGSLVNGDCVKLDSNGNYVDAGAPCGTSAPGGSNTQIQYNSSGSFAGNSGLIYNGTNVGIGSASPGTTLDISGTARMTGFVLSTTPVNGYVLTSNGSGVGSWAVASNSSQWTTTGSNIYYSTGNVGIGTSTALNQLLTIQGNIQTQGSISNTTLNIGGGNVGVGSANPGQLLDVAGTARMTGFQLPTSATSGYVLTANSSGTGTWQPTGSGSGTVSSGTVSKEAIYTGSTTVGSGIITDTGANVGIGTTNAFNVDLNGNVGIGTINPDYYGQTSNETNTLVGVNAGGVFESTAAYAAGGGPSIILGVDAGSAVTSGSRIGTVKFCAATDGTGPQDAQCGAQFAVFAEGNWSGSSIPTDFQLQTNPSGSVGRKTVLWLDDSGNVGIGTLAPTAGFQVGTDAATTGVGQLACIGTGNCLGYCTGTLTVIGSTCSTCTCMVK